MGGERIHLRENKGDKSILNTSQGSGGQESRRMPVCKDTVGGRAVLLKGEEEEVWRYGLWTF